MYSKQSIFAFKYIFFAARAHGAASDNFGCDLRQYRRWKPTEHSAAQCAKLALSRTLLLLPGHPHFADLGCFANSTAAGQHQNHSCCSSNCASLSQLCKTLIFLNRKNILFWCLAETLIYRTKSFHIIKKMRLMFFVYY